MLLATPRHSLRAMGLRLLPLAAGLILIGCTGAEDASKVDSPSTAPTST